MKRKPEGCGNTKQEAMCEVSLSKGDVCTLQRRERGRIHKLIPPPIINGQPKFSTQSRLLHGWGNLIR